MPDVKHLPGRRAVAEIRTHATPEALWNALVTPEGIARWFVDRAEGAADRTGNLVKWFFDRFRYELNYRVLSAVPGAELVLDGGPDGPVPFVLEITLRKESGQTTVTLVNSGFLDAPEWDDQFDGIVSGWRLALATLAEHVERHDGRNRTQFFAMRPSVFEYGDLAPFYRDEARLAQWLTQSGGIGEACEPCRLVLRSGDPLTGEVLARTSREVLLRWEEIGGVLALKAFSMGPGRRALCVHGSSWRMDAERMAAIEAAMQDALERLARALAADQ